jgi:hypothetical protein
VATNGDKQLATAVSTGKMVQNTDGQLWPNQAIICCNTHIMNDLQYILNQARLPIPPSRHVKGSALQISHPQWFRQAPIEQVDSACRIMGAHGDKLATTHAAAMRLIRKVPAGGRSAWPGQGHPACGGRKARLLIEWQVPCFLRVLISTYVSTTHSDRRHRF